MKKAILITGIIWLVLTVAGAITELVYGMNRSDNYFRFAETSWLTGKFFV